MDAAQELAAQIRQTEAYIATRPVELVLQPHAYQADGTGGRRLVATAGVRQPQTMRFIEPSTMSARDRTTLEGSQYSQEAILLMMPDAEADVNDQFEWDGDTWRVTEVLFPNGWSKRATVLRYGR